MTVRATWQGELVAESDETIVVEGNHYFPPSAVRRELLIESSTSTHCPWKGDASYLSIAIGDEVNEDAAWYYAKPYEAAEEIRDYVAFWHGIEIEAGPGEGKPGPSPH